MLSQLVTAYPKMSSMSDEDFESWVVATASASDTPFVSKLDMQNDTTLDLVVSERKLPAVAANLDKLVRINDALAARCRCDDGLLIFRELCLKAVRRQRGRHGGDGKGRGPKPG